MSEIIEELRREAKRVREEEEKQLETLSRFLRWIPFDWLRRWLLRLYLARYRTVRELVGTFHITNTGSLGIDISFSPIVMATLMSVGQLKMRPMVKEGKVEVVPSAMISIQGDHRVVDGRRAADFMKDLTAVLDQPERLVASSSP